MNYKIYAKAVINNLQTEHNSLKEICIKTSATEEFVNKKNAVTMLFYWLIGYPEHKQ